MKILFLSCHCHNISLLHLNLLFNANFNYLYLNINLNQYLYNFIQPLTFFLISKIILFKIFYEYINTSHMK